MKIRQRIGALFAAVLVGTGCAVALAAPAHAADYLHRIVHSSGWCLEVPIDPATGQGSMHLNEQLRLSVCGPTSGSWNQKFWFSDGGTFQNTYFIRPGHNQWCTTPGAASLPWSTIVQWSCDWNSFSEQWEQIGPDSNGLFKLRNVYSGMCLIAENGGQLGDLVRQTQDCSGGFGSAALSWSLPYA